MSKKKASSVQPGHTGDDSLTESAITASSGSGQKPVRVPRVVGIGSSAGGLEALRTMLARLTPGNHCAYIVVQHLSPTYKSHLPELLGRETSLPVQEIRSGLKLMADHIYITPPSCNVLVREGALIQQQADQSVLPKPSVNLLLESIAAEYGENAIAVILSGTGSDGASGVRSVKAAGGFTFAQQPDTARYDGMPHMAIETGCIDWVLPPDRIADEINQLCRHTQKPKNTEQNSQRDDANNLRKLMGVLRSRSRMDFSGYKPATLWRRIERRLVANRVPSLEAYLDLVATHPEELERLAKDILISVTAFMRDPAAFVALEAELRKLLARKAPGDEIRIWVPGCATGEEAYSIAMLLHRILGGDFSHYAIQIFATDVDMDAMQIARRGCYPASTVELLGREVLQHYFQPLNDAYEISKLLRGVVVFARQDLVLDPPFLRLDLISCRNVLIYLQNSIQSRLLSFFHYALVPDGLLFLGKSESVAQQDGLFTAVSKEHRVFRRNAVATSLPVTGALGSSAPTAQTQTGSGGQIRQRELRLLQLATQYFMPDSVLVDARQQIRHVFANAGGYLKLPSGKANLDLFAHLPREWKVEAQSLLRKVVQTGEPCQGTFSLSVRDADSGMVRLSVRPFDLDREERLYLLAFERTGGVAAKITEALGSAEVAAHDLNVELEHELVAAREHLQTVIEELETSNEEMQALNEEVQAANEELQATNEELEASNEELQSTNEELLTINDEMLAKTSELASANAALELVLRNVGMPMLVVDENLCLCRYNEDAVELFRIHASLQGASIERLTLPGGMPSFVEDVRRAMSERQALERVIESERRAYILRINLNFVRPDRLVGAIVMLIDQTERLKVERLLRESQQRLESVMKHSPILVAIKDLTGRYEYANEPLLRLFDVSEETLIGSSDERFLPTAVVHKLRENDLRTLRLREPLETMEDIPLGTQGERRLQMIRFPLLDAAGEVRALCIQAIDITDRNRAEAQLRLAALVIDRAAEAVMVTDARLRIISVNKAFTQITGYAEHEAIGASPQILKSGVHEASFYREMWRAINARGVWQGEIQNRHKDGSVITEWLTISVIHDDHGQVLNYVALFSDISEVIESRRKMEYLALHDELTGLPNRTLLLDRLRHALARAERHARRVALMFVDLDNFKDVNDSLGHDQGDQLLKQLSDRLVTCVRDQDTVARLGGDEFTILLEDVNESEAEVLAIRIQQALNRGFVLQGSEVYATASVGIAFFPDDGRDLQTLMQSADSAMYRAKQAGRNTFAYSTDDLKRLAAERLAIQNGLRRARDEQELEVLFQPFFAIEGQTLAGCEALMRWNSANLGRVMPERFIPIAEESGQIIALTEWMIHAVLNQIRTWRWKYKQVPRVWINISPLHFRIQSIGDLLLRQLTVHDLPPGVIGIEITETAMSQSPEHLASCLLQLKGLGVPVSLDDFGTGHSSLSRLSRLPIDTVKIDREFIDGLGGDSGGNDMEITRTVILMAHSLGMKALAEGVETDTQLDCLKVLGCDYIQGNLLSRPMTAEQLEAMFGSVE